MSLYKETEPIKLADVMTQSSCDKRAPRILVMKDNTR